MTFEPMLFVDDVEATSRWFQSLLGLRSAHGGTEYEMLMDAENHLAVQLHHADAEEHGGDRLPKGSIRGAGVLLYVKVADVRATHAKAKSLKVMVEGEPVFIKLAGHTEFVARTPDGYAIAIYQRGEV
ncbi:MAG: VOC family protein [Alphaproteobacteria bacterium]|nr:VOC family protein [Alphaproteobacteria bacterium]MBV9540376.1 VOC family protein [Alphaproteobacteria bacterium]MBV9903361.1 VOC family protein [Alphaproteobacteria bacterium]